MGNGVGDSLSSIYLDTHAAIFLHAGELERLGTEGKRQMEANDLLISPMVLLEMNYLFESKKIRYTAKEIYAALNAAFGLTLCTIPFSGVALQALELTWTRDPFDRIIVAQALVNQHATLITRDRTLQIHYRRCVW
jgi:PIN domain nuclease of toxin-antitoxin system